METVHLRNRAFWNLVIPCCNTKDKTLAVNISHVTCEKCLATREAEILRAEQIRNSF
jgi:hypothetical protein